MSAGIAKVINLPRVFGGGRMRTMPTHHFETGETIRPQQRDLNVLAKQSAKAKSAVNLARAVLADAREHERQVNIVARNEVVACEGDLIKAELAAEDADKAFWEMAHEAMGVKE